MLKCPDFPNDFRGERVTFGLSDVTFWPQNVTFSGLGCSIFGRSLNILASECNILRPVERKMLTRAHHKINDR